MFGFTRLFVVLFAVLFVLVSIIFDRIVCCDLFPFHLLIVCCFDLHVSGAIYLYRWPNKNHVQHNTQGRFRTSTTLIFMFSCHSVDSLWTWKQIFFTRRRPIQPLHSAVQTQHRTFNTKHSSNIQHKAPWTDSKKRRQPTVRLIQLKTSLQLAATHMGYHS